MNTGRLHVTQDTDRGCAPSEREASAAHEVSSGKPLQSLPGFWAIKAIASFAIASDPSRTDRNFPADVHRTLCIQARAPPRCWFSSINDESTTAQSLLFRGQLEDKGDVIFQRLDRDATRPALVTTAVCSRSRPADALSVREPASSKGRLRLNQLANALSHCFHGERLGHDVHAGVEMPVVQDGVLGEPGDE